MTIVYKIVTALEWQSASGVEAFKGSVVDDRDGFLHFSTGQQVEETVTRHFAGVEELTLVAVQAEALGHLLRWEISRNGELFPHLYAALPIEKVLWARPFSAKDVRALRSLVEG